MARASSARSISHLHPLTQLVWATCTFKGSLHSSDIPGQNRATWSAAVYSTAVWSQRAGEPVRVRGSAGESDRCRQKHSNCDFKAAQGKSPAMGACGELEGRAKLQSTEKDQTEWASPATSPASCRVIVEGDPPPSAPFGQMSFGNFNPATEKMHAEAEQRHAAAKGGLSTAKREQLQNSSAGTAGISQDVAKQKRCKPEGT
eukprot:jgi/Astpho2/264/Aster-x0912